MTENWENLTNIHNNIEVLAAIYRRHRQVESTPQASTQGSNTLRLIYAHNQITICVTFNGVWHAIWDNWAIILWRLSYEVTNSLR